jgi:hypothetical protein
VLEEEVLGLEIDGHKVETPYYDNDLILTPIISPQSVGNEPEVVQNFTWVVLVMEDGNFKI